MCHDVIICKEKNYFVKIQMTRRDGYSKYFVFRIMGGNYILTLKYLVSSSN